MANEQSYGGGLTFTGLLTIVFITLKLCNVISWSWWWVLSPVWIPLAILMLFLILLFTFIFYANMKK